MSSNTNSGSEASSKDALTDRELEILTKAWNCMKSPPEIDFPKLAAALGMTNPRSATNAWGNIKKKLFADLPPPVDDEGNPIATPAKRKRATPAKKKAAAPVQGDIDELAVGPEADVNSYADEKLVVETPTKKKRATPKKKAAAAAPAFVEASDGAAADGSEDAASETPVKKKRATPAKRKTPVKPKKAAADDENAPAEEPAADASSDNAPAAEVAKLGVNDEGKDDINMENGENKYEI
ncbi:hypothetical protein CCHL11_08129 [Colletotrichum chlorophyti]|uniref:Uncharacterized protein n=1 Tax=Colletotrichum chlorophyti TaxID=708187 RepID=A0A1Q8S1B3_9PEZI|nr:hypothetical protein CCHL11_08129 [Colletotrichum chlorophyti]